MNNPSFLCVVPLDRALFAPFGDVIEPESAKMCCAANYGTAERFHDLARLDLIAEHGRPIVSLFRARAYAEPIRLHAMERHPLSSQAFIPLSAYPYLVVVAPPGPFAVDRLMAFRASPRQGVNYAPGVWHHYLIALANDCDFLVIERDGPGVNLDEVVLSGNDRKSIELRAGAI